MREFESHVKRSGLAVLCGLIITLVMAGSAWAEAVGEQEPNNIRSEANGPILAGQVWSGAMASDYDSEWIRFYVRNPGTKVTFRVTRGVLLEHEAGFEIVMANGDAVPGGGHVELGDGVATGSMSATLDRGKYFVWVTGLVGRVSTGLTWEVEPTEGEFSTFADLQADCAASKAEIPALQSAVTKATKALAKAKKRVRGRKAAVKKAKARLAKAKKALSTAKAGSAAACAIEE